MKLSGEQLKQLLQCIKKDDRVIVPPAIGYDAGVHLVDGKYLVVSTDPCTGVPAEWFGWLLIHYAASDVALFGAKPQFCTINLLGPRPTDPATFQSIMQQTCKTADELGIAIVRGHTGTYDSLKDLLGVCTAYGTAEPQQLILPSNAKASDLILCTKPIGFETITNFSLTHKTIAQNLFGQQRQEALSKMIYMQSCVKEAQQLSQTGGVNAMHDATEGGLVAGLNELAETSKLGFRVDWESIPVPREALALQKHFGFSDEELLAMSSTGTVLAAVKPQAHKKVKEALKKLGLEAFFIGEFTQSTQRRLVRDGKESTFPMSAIDPYTMMLSAES